MKKVDKWEKYNREQIEYQKEAFKKEKFVEGKIRMILKQHQVVTRYSPELLVSDLKRFCIGEIRIAKSNN